MRRIEDGEKPMPEISTDKVCFVIAKSRELFSEDVGAEPDASNPTDDGERAILTDANGSVRLELVEFLRDLDVDEDSALVALVSIGRGDYEPDDWKSAVEAAAGRGDGRAWKDLLEIPLLPDYLEDALSAFGRSCEDFDAREETQE